MRINSVLLWVTSILLGSLLILIMMILHGSISFDTEWFKPATIATLVGGLGGALAGTWLSGVNASRQWEKQSIRESDEKKYIFNKLIKESLSLIIVSKTSIVSLPISIEFMSHITFGTGEESVLLGDMDERSKAKRLYGIIEDEMEDLYFDLESLYTNVDEMVKGGIVDWETYSKVNYFKFAFGKTKAIRSVQELASSSELEDEELSKRIKGAKIDSEEIQHYRDVFNSRQELTSLQNMALKEVDKLMQLQKDLLKDMD